jgi:RNA polymerase sigma-70 factor (ECF subfamily)
MKSSQVVPRDEQDHIWSVLRACIRKFHVRGRALKNADNSVNIQGNTMPVDGDTRGDELEQLRPYLHLVARMHLDHRLRTRIDPEDAVQDAFRKALEKWDQCRESRKAWLRHILLNHLKDLVDKMTAQKANVELEVALEYSSVRLDALLVADHSSPSQKAANNEEMARLAEALAKLPVKQQEVVILNRLHGLKLEEVASKLGLTLGATGGLLRRGLEALVRHLTFPE